MINKSTVDQSEIDRFSSLADQWWNPRGKFRPLHQLNPIRLDYIFSRACKHFNRDSHSPNAMEGLRILDLGCGGGLLSEPIARMGARIVGVDPSETNIEIAKMHARKSGVTVDYRVTTLEYLAQNNEKFDIILNMEVIEHVRHVRQFMISCSEMIEPSGLMFVGTINRTRKAQFLAIFMAENILRWLPQGTHNYEKFVTPNEANSYMQEGGLNFLEEIGVSYNIFSNRWTLSKDTDVNYMILSQRPGLSSKKENRH
ncbi:bifunctional 2-polyprenyl-6-hydroxyphenol methylase/3-demethylubiquinol 3-O-methyltransferase UbiG [Candidatus Endowatersipora endosymbiont of Watersipora subatra]|uniref:bifunctional 2-polyprenyl-6-hydroxyphenol methylase/3-demethylubiquinol 3-O-methyltransferase UbiG n=1 Tax=Candidatus Endowatersipora endosymbiont of Watersipora subatra TaxID=3077946 RepID=UPI00312CB526